MKGTNHIMLNRAFMREAIQEYFTKHHNMNVRVAEVAEVMDGEYRGAFCVSTVELPKDDLTHFQEKK